MELLFTAFWIIHQGRANFDTLLNTVMPVAVHLKTQPSGVPGTVTFGSQEFLALERNILKKSALLMSCHLLLLGVGGL